MDDFRGRIRYFGAVPMRSLTRTDMKVMIGAAWTEAGLLWHREMRPKHFTAAGAAEYGYKPRKGEPGNEGNRGFWKSYTGRKQKLKHHRRPLVWSGELERATEFRRIETKAFAKRSWMKVKLPQARKANWRHPASDINMHEELVTVSEREGFEIAERHNRTMADRLRTFGKSVTTNI